MLIFAQQLFQTEKSKKNDHNETMTLNLVRNPDILKEVAITKKASQVVIGFAAETNDLITNAEKKIKAKHLDLIVANDVSQKGIGFSADNNQVTFLFANGDQQKTAVESKQKSSPATHSYFESSFNKPIMIYKGVTNSCRLHKLL